MAAQDQGCSQAQEICSLSISYRLEVLELINKSVSYTLIHERFGTILQY